MNTQENNVKFPLQMSFERLLVLVSVRAEMAIELRIVRRLLDFFRFVPGVVCLAQVPLNCLLVFVAIAAEIAVIKLRSLVERETELNLLSLWRSFPSIVAIFVAWL